MKILDTFAGIGGFSYAAEKLIGGFETTQFIEIDPFCQKVLKKHWPHVPIHDDIRTFTAKPGEYQVITGGFPCQDISTAGHQKGITKETRSGLFYELMRVIRMVRPQYVVLENVAAILNRGLDIVLRELSEAGYDAEWSVISASSLGACHQRSRWWLVAYPNNNGSFATEKSRSTKKTDGGAEERENQTSQFERSSESRDTETVQLDASDPNGKGLQRSAERRLSGERLWPEPSRYNQTTPHSLSPRTQIQYEQRGSSIWNLPSSYGKEGSTLSPNWQAYESEPCLRRGDDGLSNWTHRLKALGNSVVPQCAAIPLQRVKDLYATTS
jgi:DNA (cytosine-5)-methyltransferase 1|tara:strand:+ start:560 stop:1540 length:981 start_codon:yes stop_codon:yes gene_type:complete